MLSRANSNTPNVMVTPLTRETKHITHNVTLAYVTVIGYIVMYTVHLCSPESLQSQLDKLHDGMF